jgi:glucose/mannose-6-phosphate isomerase
MLRLVMDIPLHCQDGRYRVLNRPPRLKPKNIRSVLVSGLGGSAIGGDLFRSLVSKTASFSVTVNRHYDLPVWVSRDTLVICSSYSGNTEETLSVIRQALAKKVPLMVITSGGELLGLAKARKLPYCELPGGLPARAAMGYSFTTLFTAMECLGLLPSYEEDFQATMELLIRLSREYGWLTPAFKNPAKQLAKFLYGRLPLIYAGQDHLEAVALRWKSQINENAKQIALMNALPEANHNEVLAFTFPDPLSKKIVGILLQHPQGDHPRIQKRFNLLKELLQVRTAGIREVRTQGKSLLSQILSMVYLGDFVSVYLAYLKGVDPTPIHLVEQFKSRLGKMKYLKGVKTIGV